MGKPVSNRSYNNAMGRRAFLCGGALATGAALGLLAGCGQDAASESKDGDVPRRGLTWRLRNSLY